MKKFPLLLCLFGIFCSCHKEDSTTPHTIFRFLDHTTLAPIQGVKVYGEGTCVEGINGMGGTCISNNKNIGITGPDGKVCFGDLRGYVTTTTHPDYYSLEKTEHIHFNSQNYHLFRKAGADLTIIYRDTVAKHVLIVVDAEEHRSYLKQQNVYYIDAFFSNSFDMLELAPSFTRVEAYLELLGGIENEIRIITGYPSGTSRDSAIRFTPIPNQRNKLTIAL